MATDKAVSYLLEGYGQPDKVSAAKSCAKTGAASNTNMTVKPDRRLIRRTLSSATPFYANKWVGQFLFNLQRVARVATGGLRIKSTQTYRRHKASRRRIVR